MYEEEIKKIEMDFLKDEERDGKEVKARVMEREIDIEK